MDDHQDHPVTVEVTVEAPAGQVWSSLRDPKQIRRWHGWQYDQLDAEIREIYLDESPPTRAPSRSRSVAEIASSSSPAAEEPRWC